MSDSDTSSSSDEMYLSSSESDLELFVDRVKPKNEDYFEITIPQYNEIEFREHFRVSRHVADGIAENFQNSQYFHYQSGGNGKLNSLQQVLIFLWFVGHQTASFRDVGDRFNVAISSVHVIIRKVGYFLSNMSPQIITWPANEEKAIIEAHFNQKGFPRVIGCIDGTHIKINKPSNDPDSYLNRKSFHSIQLQVVCDHQRKIRDVFVGFPGSVHDSRIYRASPLGANLQELCGQFFILGDSGYPCLPNLLTPFKDRGQLTARQRNYNIKLSSNRYIIEHCFGMLKQKFRVLYHCSLKSIPDTVHLIRACCVLHNLAIEDNFDYIVQENIVEEMQELGQEVADDRNGILIRNQVANMLA